MEAYKVFTHDLRSPIRGGDPIITGPLPFRLPDIDCDQSNEECSSGWNACRTPEDALRISGFWPNGRPSRLFRLTEPNRIIERGDKVRARAWTVTEEILDVRPIIETFSRQYFGELVTPMIEEQMAWREALDRPEWSVDAVEKGLSAALEARGLKWSLRRFDSTQDAWSVWTAGATSTIMATWVIRDAWDTKDDWNAKVAGEDWAAWASWDVRDTRIAKVAWDAWAAWDVRDARVARVDWAARASWDARNIWDIRVAEVAKVARDVWAARNARAALMVDFVGRSGWIEIPHDQFTVGLRDAYRAGLAIALATGPNELGWAMI